MPPAVNWTAVADGIVVTAACIIIVVLITL